MWGVNWMDFSTTWKAKAIRWKGVSVLINNSVTSGGEIITHAPDLNTRDWSVHTRFMQRFCCCWILIIMISTTLRVHCWEHRYLGNQCERGPELISPGRIPSSSLLQPHSLMFHNPLSSTAPAGRGWEKKTYIPAISLCSCDSAGGGVHTCRNKRGPAES